MHFKTPRKLIHYAIFLLLTTPLIAQVNGGTKPSDELPKHLIELRHDNDFFVFTDRYYTTGSFITFRSFLKNGYFPDGQEQLAFSLIHQYYTPANIHSADIEEFDRPYVGFLALESGWSLVNATSFVDFSVLLGMAGPVAGAQEFQNLFHSNGGIDTPPWIGQINNSFHINLKSSYAKEWKIFPNPYGLYLALKPTLVVGTKDLYFQQEGILYFGKRNTLNKSSAYNQIKNLTKELYFSLSMGYRYVHYNALLEGHPIGDGSIFVVNSESNLLLFKFEFVYNAGRNIFKILQNYNTHEIKRVKAHLTFGISLARNF